MSAAELPSFEELYAEILALPPGQTGEILGPGWLRVMSRPGAAHSRVARRALRLFGGVDLDGGGEWLIDLEREIRLPSGRLYVPDLVGWRVGPDTDLSFAEANPVTRMPDWACEILSRSTQRADRVIKLPQYAAAGVGHVWVVDLEGGAVEVYAPRGGLPCLVASARADEAVPLPPFGLPIALGELMAPPRRRRGDGSPQE